MPTSAPNPGESLADLFPDVAAQWHPTKNNGLRHGSGPLKGEPLRADNVIAGSNKKVWWKCEVADDHEWKAVIRSRTHQGNGCRACANQQVSVTNSLATQFPEIARQWNYEENGETTPDQVVSGSHTKFSWKCTEGPDHTWVTSAKKRTYGAQGCPSCSNPPKKVSVTNSLTSLFPRVAEQWHPYRNGETPPDTVIAGSNKRFWWKCPEGPDHEWQTSPNNRTSHGSGCPMCSGFLVSVTNSLATRRPDIAGEWHPTKNGSLTPDQVVAGAKGKAWWKCDVDDDHEWQATVDNRSSKGSGCPCCSMPPKQVSSTNSLAALYPQVALEWHPTKNTVKPDQVIGQSNKRAWWQCSIDPSHEWSVSVGGRTGRGRGCPLCTLTPRSAQEMRLAHELSSLINFDLEAHKMRFAGRLRDVDIVLDDLKVVVEFDGSYWHSKKVDKDREKTALMEEAGWQVIRVRERPLDSIHVNDVMVDTMASAKTVADLVLNKIGEVTGTDVPQLDEYLASEGPWREAQALKAIRAYQAERAAKKAARAKKKS